MARQKRRGRAADSYGRHMDYVRRTI
jgi:hypothetical protein